MAGRLRDSEAVVNSCKLACPKRCRNASVVASAPTNSWNETIWLQTVAESGSGKGWDAMPTLMCRWTSLTQHLCLPPSITALRTF